MATRNRFRSRRTSEPNQYQLVYRFGSGSVFSTVDWGTYSYLTWSERFHDQFEAPKSGHAYPDHPCRHERVVGSTSNIGTWDVSPLTGGFEPDRHWIVSEDDITNVIPSIPPDLLDDIAYAAMQSFVTDIKEEGSILNFIYELKDFGPLLGSLGGLFGRVLEFLTKPGLSWEFAIKPFIEDLQKFFGVLNKVKRKLEFLEKFDGKETILNYNAKHVEERMDWAPEEPTSGQVWPFPPVGLCYCTALDITVRCHARVQIRCRGIRDCLRRLDAYMKAFGIASILQWLKAIYKAIPFTWLLDYMFKTNRLLDALKTSTFGQYGSSPIKVLSTTHSIRVRATVKVWGLLPGPTSPKVVGTYTVHRFSRGPGLPFGGSGSILRYHALAENASMLAILLQILLPGIDWKRIF